MTSRARSRVTVAAGLVFGLGLFVLLVWRARLPLVLDAMSRVSIPWLAAATALKMTALGLKIVRWHVAWRAAFRQGGQKLTSATLVGFLMNGTLPARLGDVARVQLAARANERTFSASLGSLVFDRSFDALVLAAMVLLATVAVAIPGLSRVGWLTLLPLLLPAAVVVVALLTRGADWLPRPIRARLDHFRAGVSAIRSPRAIAATAAITVAVWVIEVTAVLLVLWSFHIPATMSTALVLTVATAVGLAVPSAPSGIGLHQAIYQVVLAQVAVSASVAVAASVLSVGTMLAALGVATLIAVLIEGVPFSLLLPRKLAGESERA